jgi:hypothetical protein
MTSEPEATSTPAVVSVICFILGVGPTGGGEAVVPVGDWFPLATVGLTFTTLGGLKISGQSRGIVGGGDKPWRHRLLAGSCPKWS